MVKYKLGKIVRRDGNLMDMRIVAALSLGTYVIMKDDNTAELSFGSDANAKTINAVVEGDVFNIEGEKIFFQKVEKGRGIEFVFQGDVMTFIQESVYDVYFTMMVATAKKEAAEKMLALTKIKVEDIRKKSRKYTLLGKVSWNRFGAQDMEKATSKETIEFFGEDEGYGDKHYVRCSIQGYGDGTWVKSDVIRGGFDIGFSEKNCTATFEEADSLVYLNDGPVTYHFLLNGAKMPEIARLNWEED